MLQTRKLPLWWWGRGGDGPFSYEYQGKGYGGGDGGKNYHNRPPPNDKPNLGLPGVILVEVVKA